MGLKDFKTTQTLPLHIFNDRIMPGVRDVHGDLQNSPSLKDTSGGMAYLTQMSLMKKNTAVRSLRSYNNWNDILIKTTKQCDFTFWCAL